MQKSESVLENQTRKILWGFEIQRDPLILARRPGQVSIYKKKRSCYLMDFAVPADHRGKFKESEKTFTRILSEI